MRILTLSQQSRIIGKDNIGLHRDDVLFKEKKTVLNLTNIGKYDKCIETTRIQIYHKKQFKNNKLPRRKTKFRKKNIWPYQKRKQLTYLYTRILEPATFNHQTDTNIHLP